MARPALAAARAVAVLDFLAGNAGEEFTLSELARQLAVNVASMHAVLAELADAGYVVRHPRLRTFALGPSVVALGSAALARHPAIDLAREEARRLSEELGLEVAITTLAGGDILFLDRVGGHRARSIAVHVGDRVPLEPPTGAVFVAWSDPTTWLARTRDRRGMERLLDSVRTRGWAVALRAGDTQEPVATLSRRRSYDVSMVAAPVFGPTGEATVSLTLLGFEPALTGARVEELGDAVRDAGIVVTRRSGGRVPSQ
jgi:DNA-binding IclR family transcriptional regulator